MGWPPSVFNVLLVWNFGGVARIRKTQPLHLPCTMDGQYQRELKIAFGALQNAARLSQSIVQSQDKGVIEKEDLSPVTVADFAIQALLTATFKNAFPHDNFVGEEDASAMRDNPTLLDTVWELLSRVANDEESALLCKVPSTKEEMCDLVDECGSTVPGGAGSGRTWVFDPIDGTKTYIRGELYAINIGLLIDGVQTLGVVGCPNMSMDVQAPLRNEGVDKTGEGGILFAVRGEGAFARPMQGETHRVEPTRLPRHSPEKEAPDERIRFVTCSTIVDSALPGIHDLISSKLEVGSPSCDLVPWVLRWATLALNLGNTTVWVYKRPDRRAKVWDHAGAMLLFEETGGKITDVQGKKIDLTAGRKLVANLGFVAARGEALHARVLKTVQEVLKEQGREEFLST